MIGGTLKTSPGSRLHGDVFQFIGPLPDLNGWNLIAALWALLVLRTLVVSLVVAAAAWIASGRHAVPLSAALAERPGRTISAGVLAVAGLLALSVLGALSVVGIPLAPMIWGMLIAALPVGVASIADILDLNLRGRAPYLIAAIPLIGDALLALTLAVGIGTLLRLLTQPRMSRRPGLSGG